ncbi:MAG: hypothetical protein ACR2RV_09235, partial [Verrucomicrobiales bacterium]
VSLHNRALDRSDQWHFNPVLYGGIAPPPSPTGRRPESGGRKRNYLAETFVAWERRLDSPFPFVRKHVR